MRSLGLIGFGAPTSSFALEPAMTLTDPPKYLSPKRKREPSESDYYSPSASPTSTVSIASLQEARIREEAEPGRHSPRAAVAGRFRELAIRGDRFPDPRASNRDFQQPPTLQAEQATCASDSHDRSPNHMPEPLSDYSSDQHDVQGHHVAFESAPQRTPTPTPDNALVTPASTPSKRRSTPSPRKKSDIASPSKGRKQRLSPPPTAVLLDNPFTWHDHEITGHNPTDPTDDGYGINGVGFKPTAAIAWARSQKRQRQVAEWKSREAREAREKRRERRNEGSSLDRLHSIHKGAIQKRVKFDVQDRQ
ncbi:uncharacterized protein N7482_000703 [Penicillium canariense]|uniref:Uncharacterized protein n=1 Tax=Penicillium canariense TaxID=189055 RepID=A0A9W9IFW9_9EURO|nr:uncharacterized protein N7482_000703 [Penicillium canariense]KAJ5174826.1 hypothetical protein N7482_000703 [Penicillium canariense]